MDQITWNHHVPEESGSYTTSISRKMLDGGDFVFTYVAYYDKESDTWYKATPWDDHKPHHAEIITDDIVGWYPNITYMGMVRLNK